jgi:UDP-N-acetylglucosamine 3-dehydrogenase
MTLRAGVLGLGVMGRHHSRVLNELEGVEFKGVYDPSPDVADEIEGKPVVRDLEQFLDMGFDYCVVAAPTTYHLDIGRTLAERGIHALIEKPVASTTADAIALRDLFANARLVGGVGHIERYNPALQSARQRIEDGLIGEIYQVATRRQGPFPGRIADVGVIKDLATHDIDLTAWVTQQEYVSINARTAFRSGREHEDMVVAVGTLSKGAIATHTVNWLTPFKERTTIITGEKGALVADTLTADLTHYQNGVIQNTWDDISRFRGVSEGDVTRFALDKKEPLRAEHQAFRDAVLTGNTEAIVTLAEGTNVVRIAEDMALDGSTYRL